MGDLGTGLAWLCGTCCGLRNADITADGSRFGNANNKRHPAERLIEEEFMARNYRKDAAGHLHAQPTPTTSMLPRQNSDDSKKSKRSAKKQEQEHAEEVDMESIPRQDLPVITVDHPPQTPIRRQLAPVEEVDSLKSPG